MKKAISILFNLFVVLNLLCTPFNFKLPFDQCVCAYAENSDAQEQSDKLSSEDWKIVIDGNESSSEFDFIQKNIASLDLSDNGQSLLILGIVMVVISIIGVAFSALMLYRIYALKKKHLNKRRSRQH